MNKGGCIFCSPDGSAAPTANVCLSIREQMHRAANNFKRTGESTAYIAYFQAYTNTYGDRETLRKAYDESLLFPGVTGLMIGTRPDCIDEKIAHTIASYIKPKFETWVELGFQTAHDRSLKLLNRGHDSKDSLKAIEILAEKKIPICLHIILGIPGESREDMIETAKIVSQLPVQGVKIHHLHIIKGTPLEAMYNRAKFKVFTLNEYVSVICDFIENLRQDIIVHRLMGDRMEDTLVEPRWGLHKGTVIKAIEDEFRRRSTFQGFLTI